MDKNYKIILEPAPNLEDIDFIEENLDKYNNLENKLTKLKPIVVFVRDNNNKILGGLTGWTIGTWFHIQNFWIEESIRFKGYGSCLLNKAENEALERGCHVVDLTTFSFQYTDFYKKRGYVVFGELDNIGGGHKIYFMKKNLINC